MSAPRGNGQRITRSRLYGRRACGRCGHLFRARKDDDVCPRCDGRGMKPGDTPTRYVYREAARGEVNVSH